MTKAHPDQRALLLPQLNHPVLEGSNPGQIIVATVPAAGNHPGITSRRRRGELAVHHAVDGQLAAGQQSAQPGSEHFIVVAVADAQLVLNIVAQQNAYLHFVLDSSADRAEESSPGPGADQSLPFREIFRTRGRSDWLLGKVIVKTP